jgi:cell division septation protein DedD
MIGGAVIALLVLGGIFWGAYPNSNDAAQPVPVVRADIQPYKTAPDDPGGMDVAHQGSTVFSAARSGDPEDGVENLLAEEPTEEAMPRSQLFAGLNTGVDQPAPAAELPKAMPPQPIATSEDTASASPQDVAPSAGATKTTTTTTTTTTAAVKPAEPKPVDMAAAAQVASQIEPTAGAATAAPKMVTDGTHFVQLASIREKSGSEKEWKKLTAAHSSLSGMNYRTVSADLGAKGTFHRIQAGPMSKAEATTLCNAIKAKTPGGCLIVGK